jgi:hypothetical protein
MCHTDTIDEEDDWEKDDGEESASEWVGKTVIPHTCRATTHDNASCVCKLLGTEVVIVGVHDERLPTFSIRGIPKLLSLAEFSDETKPVD